MQIKRIPAAKEIVAAALQAAFVRVQRASYDYSKCPKVPCRVSG